MLRRLYLVVGIFVFSAARAAAAPTLIAQNRPASSSTAFQRGSACIAAAARLGACSSAVSPVSTLTSVEESDCCAGLLAFQQAQCYCLPPQSLDMISKGDRWAYRRRLNSLHKAHLRCGWESFTCPAGQSISSKYLGVDVDSQASERAASIVLPSWLWASSSQEETLDSLAWEPHLPVEPKGAQRSLGSLTSTAGVEVYDPAPQQVDQIAELSEYLTAALDLADSVSQLQDAQVEITIEMTLDPEVEPRPHSGEGIAYKSCLYKVLLGGSGLEWLNLNIWLGLSVLVLLAALLASLSMRRQSSPQQEASPYRVVSAAEEAALEQKLSVMA